MSNEIGGVIAHIINVTYSTRLYHSCNNNDDEMRHEMTTRKNTKIAMKTCTRSLIAYPATPEYFYRDKTQKDGLSSWSKIAEREYNNAYYRALKNANVTKKSSIDDDKSRAKFERDMRPVRVTRNAKS